MTIKGIAEIDKEVDRLFTELNAMRGDYCVNPVTGGRFIWGDDPIAAQKEAARRALVALDWFANNGPADAQPLPVSHHEREVLKSGGILHILAWYARSLEALGYDVKRHPSFEDYACGVMARPETPDFILNDPVLRRRFPPRHLVGLGAETLWRAPLRHVARRATAA
jgi:hypothetical protein